jgi:acetyl esterase/lipase
MVTTDLRVERDVVFAKGGDIDLTCDVYYPPSAVDKRTAVIHLYGGGFRGGSKERMQTPATLYAERGFLGVAPRYRLVTDALWPAQINDVQACVDWVQDDAERLGIDGSKVVLVGHSAGGILSLVTAGLRARASNGAAIAAVVAYYPPSEINWRPDGSIDPVMPPGSTDEDFRRASPITYMTAGYPPTLLMHGTGDRLVAFSHSRRLFDALAAAGVPAELYLPSGMDHDFDSNPDFAEICAQLAALFIDRHVSSPRTYPPYAPGGRRS